VPPDSGWRCRHHSASGASHASRSLSSARSRSNSGYLGSDNYGRPDPWAGSRRRHSRPDILAVDFCAEPSLGLIAILGVGQVPRTIESTAKAQIDAVGLALLVIGVGSVQLALDRRMGQQWPFSAETAIEAGLAIAALVGIAFRSSRSQFTLF